MAFRTHTIDTGQKIKCGRGPDCRCHCCCCWGWALQQRFQSVGQLATSGPTRTSFASHCSGVPHSAHSAHTTPLLLRRRLWRLLPPLLLLQLPARSSWEAGLVHVAAAAAAVISKGLPLPVYHSS